MKRRWWLSWLTGFAGRLFLWFWLALTLMLLGNILLSQHLRDEAPLRPATANEQQQLQRLERRLQRFADRPLARLLDSRVSRVLVLFNPTSLQPLNRQRIRHWRIPELVASNDGLQVLEHGPLRALGPFSIATADGAVKAVWLMPPQPMSAWQRFWQGPAWVRLLLSSLLVMVLSLALAAWLARPIRQLSRAARRLGDGELSARVHPGGGELGQLGRDFNAMAQKLEDLLAGQKRLLADVSHELRSPLTRLKLAAGLLSDAQHDNKYLQRIEKECDTLEHLIEQVLTLSRLEAALYQEAPQQGDLCEQVNSAVQDWRFQCPDKHITLAAPAEQCYSFRPQLLQRVLDNLLSNACRYSEHIEVALQPEAGGYRLSVCDDGPGVVPERLDKLFEPFYRGDPARGHQGQTGLGLAIADAAARAMGGTLSVALRAPHGLCFTLRLPERGAVPVVQPTADPGE